MPSRNRSRKERWRLGVEPVITICCPPASDGEDEKNFVGLKCWLDSDDSECDGDAVLKPPGANLLNGDERCFGDSRDVAIFMSF